ncbi:MAG: SH3 domain-containing protein [Bacillus sp. (in: firmicutes)]
MKEKSNKVPLKLMSTSIVLSAGLLMGSEVIPLKSTQPLNVEAATVYYKTTANLNLRSSASTSASILATIPKGKQVTYISTSGSWYKVKYGTLTGFVSSSYLQKVTSSTPTTTTSTKVYTTTANLNMRKTASTSSQILVTIPKGKTVTYLSATGNWYKVKYGSSTGFVSKDYIKVTTKTTSTTTSSTAIAATKFKTTSNLNLRSKAATNGSVLLTIPKGKVVTATAKSGSWYKVSYGGKTGWVSDSYLSEYYQYTSTSITHYRTKSAGALYTTPDTKKSAAYSMPVNNVFQSTQKVVNSKGETWYRVAYSGKNYYIKSTIVEKVTPATISKTNYTAKEATHLYSFAGDKHSKLVSIPKGATVSSTYRIGDWYKVTYSGKTGYINIAKFTKSTSGSGTSTETEITATKYETTSNLNLRSTPATSGTVLLTIPKSTVVTATAKSGDWYKVTYNGKTGWVSGGYLVKYSNSSAPAGTSITQRVYVTTSNLNMRSSDSSSSQLLDTIPKGVKVTSDYKTNKGWYRVYYGGQTGYVSGSYLMTEAVASSVSSFENNRNSYIFMDLRTTSSVTASQIDSYIAKNTTPSNSVLYGKGSVFIKAANKYGVNALYLAAHAIHESNFGKSNISLAKNNLFGYGSYDLAPFVSSVRFTTVDSNIEFIAQKMKATYLNPSSSLYNGAYLGYTAKDANGSRINSLSKGMNFYYASDSNWGKVIAKHMEAIMPYSQEKAVGQAANTSYPANPSFPNVKDTFPAGTVAVAKSPLKLYTTRDSSTAVVATIPSGKTFYLQEKWNNYWLKVQYNGKTYYTNSVSFSKYTSYISVKNLGRVTASSLNVRSSASTSGSVIDSLPKFTYVEIAVDSSNSPILQNGWYKVKLASGKTGWVSKDYITLELK